MMHNDIEFDLSLPLSDFTLNAKLSLPASGVTAIFGHSGSGKTSLLRCMAGLQRAHGHLRIKDKVWQDDQKGIFLPTHQRELGYVFQEASLFSHLNVQDNLRFAMKRIATEQQKVSLDFAIDLLGIKHLMQRKPEHLSGGERQRVAIARALLSSPQLLLMDEPLAALDHKRKAEILPYLERLHDELAIPLLYVSHSPDEVARLADHLVLLDQGKVIASGALQDTLARLDLPAIFHDDAGVVIQALIGAHEDHDHLSRLDFLGGAIYVGRQSAPIGTTMRCRIHARDVSITLEKQNDTSILNLVHAKIVGIATLEHPANVLVRLDANGTALLARITQRSCNKLNLHAGKQVWAQIKAVALLD